MKFGLTSSRIFLTSLFCGLLSIADVNPTHGAPVLQNIRFNQVDYYELPDGNVVTGTLWGSMTYSYNPDSIPYYLNVAASNTPTGPLSWIIQNAPLVSLPFANSSRTEKIDIDLSDLNMTKDEDWPEVFYSILIEDNPISTWTSLAADRASVYPITYRFASADYPATAPTELGSPFGIKNKAEVAEQSASRIFDSIEEALNTCAAGAFARSIDWLNTENSLAVGLGAQDIYQELRNVGVSVDDPNKFDFPDWIKEKSDWASEKTNGKIVTKTWDSGSILPPINGVPESSGDFWKWLKSEIDQGEDVEVAYYTLGGAHIVTISDYILGKDGSIILHYHDDQDQDNPGGDGGVAKKVSLKLKNNAYYFGGDSQKVYAAVSESMPVPAPFPMLGLGVAFRHSRKLRYRLRQFKSIV